MEILVLTGSPREGGNTELLAEAYSKGAKKAGHNVVTMDVGKMDINPCHACGYCFQHDGTCVQKDDMQGVMEQLRKSDMLVLASPIYYFGLSAQIKAAIDRFFASGTKPLPIRQSALLMVHGDPNQAVAQGAITMYKAMAGYLKWEDKGILQVGGINDPGAVKDTDGLERAEKAGAAL